MSKERIIYLDVLRIIACCLIVLMHSPHPQAGNPGMLLVPLCFITAVGVGLFFMVSGALLLPIRTNTTSFLKRRFGKIVGPLFFWTLFYLCVSVITGERSISSLPYALASIPFSVQGHGVLWFMYTLAGLYLLAPIISPFMGKASKRELNFYLILWAIALCLPVFANWVGVDRGPKGMLYYFSGYAGYFLLGYYMHTFKPCIPNRLIPLLYFIPVACLFYFKLNYDREGLLYDYFWYLSIFVVMMCVAWFDVVRKFVLRFQMRDSLVLKRLSDSCFGIYLIHIFIMRHLLWNIDMITYSCGGIGQIIITWVLTYSISFALTWTISYIPYSEYIIGYSSRKRRNDTKDNKLLLVRT